MSADTASITNRWNTVFAGLAMPDDLVRLLDARTNGITDERGLHVSEDALAWFRPQDAHPLVSHNYLNEADRADPDTLANVRAMDWTARRFVFVAEFEGGVLGYWLCPEARQPSLWHLDTEGQYNAASGLTLAQCWVDQAVLADAAVAAQARRDFLASLGITVAKETQDEIYERWDASRFRIMRISPQTFRSVLYAAMRDGFTPS